MSKLDDGKVFKEQDPQGMGELIYQFPEQCEKAFDIGMKAELPPLKQKPAQVVLFGMGGSAIGGDLVRSLLESEMEIPFLVLRDYTPPAFVGPQTLVLASSYSGNTEETLNAYDIAKKKGAQIIAITSGGELDKNAAADGFPLVTIPGGIMPRAALGYSFVPILLILQRLGLCNDKTAEFKEMVGLIKKMRDKLSTGAPAAGNQSKQLAEHFYGKIPCIYGSQPWKAVVATRWKGQMNENAKNTAAWNAFPELNHNETVGWEAPPAVTKQIAVVILKDREDSPKMQKRMEATATIMRGHAGGIDEVWSSGDSVLARMFSLIHIGDWASYYLAILNGIDPTPVKSIDYLKGQLATVK